MRGRGAASNPANRFVEIALEADPEAAAEAGADETPAPATRVYRDLSRSIISTNDSPDIGFEASINPYRGCEHGCVYCLAGETPILMGDGTVQPLADARRGDEIYGVERRGWYLRYVRTRVLDHWRVAKPAVRVTLEDGTEIVAGEDHRFLTERGWKFVTGAGRGPGCRPHLTTGNKMMGVGAFAAPPAETEAYRRGYLCGMIRGDALLKTFFYGRPGRAHGSQHQFRFALVDDEGLTRTRSYLAGFGVETHEFVFQKAVGEGRRPLRAIRTNARAAVERVREIVAWPPANDADDEAWTKGFLAGIFDAEGSYGGGILRVSNTDREIVDRTLRALARLGFRAVVEEKRRAKPVFVVRLTGGLREALRFFHATDPAIRRKRAIDGQAVKSAARLGVAAVEPLGLSLPLYDITTGMGNFVANGVVSHNCYARPTHEYLGWSAGLDFETRIMAKTDAPALLRKALASRRWAPKVIAMSGVTDPYQPVEKRLRITRGCLEILAEFRNPVAIITKNHLVTRDADVLAGMSAWNGVAVCLSVTTLDARLAAAMEPRASSPRRRLAAIEALARAGVPVGVNVAPVVPGLTDHEVPAILKAAARAGARFAGWTMLRLPYAVKDLFTEWLCWRAPRKRDKVLGLVRGVRGGRLNDSTWGERMSGEGAYARQIGRLFDVAARKAGLGGWPDLSTAAFRRPAATPRRRRPVDTRQLALFASDGGAA